MIPSDNELMLACLARHRTPAQDSIQDVRAAFVMNEVKAAFVLRGTTLNQWAKSHGFDPSHVQKSVVGQRRGPVARKLLEAVMNSVRGGS